MKLGYELTIEQTQKLVMTPELIQAIQILQFNTQELDHFVQEQLLTNPVLEKVERAESSEPQEPTEPPEPVEKEPEYDWAEHFKEREYDDISYHQWTSPKESNEYTFEQFVSSDVTLTEHLLLQLQLTTLVSLIPNTLATSSTEDVRYPFSSSASIKYLATCLQAGRILAS